MKCALELLAIQKAKQEEIARAEAIRKEKEEREKRERTLAMCEEFSEELEKLASLGRDPAIQFKCSSDYERVYQRSHTRYADEGPEHYCSGKFDIELMKQYFAEYCFRITETKTSFRTYGCGSWRGYALSIEPDPQCF